MSHECSACGGTGCDGRGYYAAGICSVCLGSGRCSDVRTARDAMVDAETLRAHTATLKGGADSWVALAHGRMAEHKAYRGDELLAYEYGRYAARAAFRAVPGLKGE